MIFLQYFVYAITISVVFASKWTEESWGLENGKLFTSLNLFNNFDENGKLRLPKGEVWLDIGLNIWKTSARSIGREFDWLKTHDGFYVAFEPIIEKWAYHIYQSKTQHRNLGDLYLPGATSGHGVVLPIAVADANNSMIDLNLSPHDGCSSIFRQRDATEIQLRGWKGYGKGISSACGKLVETRKVPSITLRSVLQYWFDGKEVEHMHVDVQGAEMSVIKSAGDSIRQVKRIILEVPNPKCNTLTHGTRSCTEIFSTMNELYFDPEDAIQANRHIGLKRGFTCSDVPWEKWNNGCEFDILFVRRDVPTYVPTAAQHW